jgi:hypothetical protein
MTADELKQKAAEISVAVDTPYAWLQELICDGFLDVPVSSADIVHRIAEKFGRQWETSRVQVYMRKFVGVVHAVKPRGLRTNYWVLPSMSRSDALLLIGKTHQVLEIEHSLFASELELKMQRSFSQELDELRSVFGKHGNCSAFLLRKILEKLLVISFRKSGKGALIEDPRKPGRLIGLEAMIELAMKERVNSAPILTGKTGSQISGIKFLGDTAAHNPMVNVDVADILPQMPFIVTAYKELALHL